MAGLVAKDSKGWDAVAGYQRGQRSDYHEVAVSEEESSMVCRKRLARVDDAVNTN